MNKELTFYINNMAYTISVTEVMEKHLRKFLDPEKNNDTKDLLAAYIQMTQEHIQIKDDIEQISQKLVRF